MTSVDERFLAKSAQCLEALYPLRRYEVLKLRSGIDWTVELVSPVVARVQSGFLRKVIANTETVQIEVEVPRTTGRTISLMVKYFYTGQLELNLQTAFDLADLAVYLNVPEVLDRCADFLISRPQSTGDSRHASLPFLRRLFEVDEKVCEKLLPHLNLTALLEEEKLDDLWVEKLRKFLPDTVVKEEAAELKLCLLEYGGKLAEFEPRTTEWRRRETRPPVQSNERSWSAIVHLDDRLFVIGGYCARPRMVLDETRILDLETLKWREGPRLHEGRSSAGAAVLPGNTIYVMGGQVDLQGVWSRSVEHFRLPEDRPPVRRGPRMPFEGPHRPICLVGPQRRVFLLSKRDNRLAVLDAGDNSWSERRAPPFELPEKSVVGCLNGHVYVFTETFQSAFYDLSSDTWTAFQQQWPIRPTYSGCQNAVVFADTFYALGMTEKEKKEEQQDGGISIFCFDMVRKAWRLFTRQPCTKIHGNIFVRN